MPKATNRYGNTDPPFSTVEYRPDQWEEKEWQRRHMAITSGV